MRYWRYIKEEHLLNGGYYRGNGYAWQKVAAIKGTTSGTKATSSTSSASTTSTACRGRRRRSLSCAALSSRGTNTATLIQ